MRNMIEPMVSVHHLSHRYGDRTALNDISLSLAPGRIYGFLGANGSGKTTLFRILSTLIPPQDGEVLFQGLNVVKDRDEVRRQIGLVFQAPSLDKQLTARENLRHHGHLYGLRGAELKSRIDEMLAGANLTERAHERVGKFSGGMRRRVELAKGMLTKPRVLLLDEPSTGLDPAARIDLWESLNRARRERGVTVLLTTHLMDEADRCDQIAILDAGNLLAFDAPSALKSRIGGDVIWIRTSNLNGAKSILRDRFNIDASIVDDQLRVEQREAHQFIPRIIESLPPGSIESIAVSKPTLEDVFIRLTGRRYQRES